MPDPPEQVVLLYDSDCGFCKWSLDKVLAWDRRGRVRPVAISSEEGGRLLAGLREEERLASWHLVTTDGTLRSGGAAAAPLASELPAGTPLGAIFSTFPRSTDRAYRFVSGHRDRWARMLGIDDACELRHS